MTRLPTVAGDGGAWGTVLNDYLTQNVVANYTLSTGTNAEATTLIVDKAAAGMFAGGAHVAVGATTSKCEVRRVTAVSSATLTLSSALKYAHSAGEFVWVTSDYWVPLEWFGCKANEATFDSFPGVQQAFNDSALTSGLAFGITGRASRFYCATPLCINDNTFIQNVTVQAKSPFSVDPLLGTCNDLPSQFFVTLGGQFVTVSSVDTGANTITLSGSIGTGLGERMTFYTLQGGSLPSPLQDGRAYYLKTNPSGNTYTISLDRDGTELDLTTSGSGTMYCYSPGAARMRWDNLTIEGNEVQALNGLIASTQQPSVARNLRIQNFPGPRGCAWLSGQQGDYYTPQIGDGSVGINFSGDSQFLYFYGGSYEDCDILLQYTTTTFTGATLGAFRDCHFYGGHWESPGIHTAQFQTVLGDAAVSAGTFTLTFSSQTTGAINHNASAATIQAALEALSNIAPGDVTCTDIGGGLPNGSCQISFQTAAGAYRWDTLGQVTIATGGLTGGVYTINRTHPNARCISLTAGGVSGLSVHGSVLASGGVKPDGTSIDFLTNESTGHVNNGYLLETITSTGQGGYAVNDIPRTILVPWGDSVAYTCSERLNFFSVSGSHGGTESCGWWLGGRLGGAIVWAEYDEELRIKPTAKLVIGDGTPVKRLTTGATSVADGGTVTHSLGATPDVVTVTPSISGEFVSVTTIGASTFTVAIKKHDGTAGTTQTLYWEARDI